MSQCVSLGPLPSTGHGADNTENTSSVFLYNHLEWTTAESTASLLLWSHRVRENVFSMRCIATVHAWTTENTVPVLFAACVLRALPSNGSMHHNIFWTFCFQTLVIYTYHSKLVAMIHNHTKPTLKSLYFNLYVLESKKDNSFWTE
jgi:hypothetical protein